MLCDSLGQSVQGSKNPEELLENLKLELFSEEVFVFSPKGDLVVLPKGATPVDFAYHLHTDIGNHCAGAKVNGRIVPLNYRLLNGDMVEIITNPSYHKARYYFVRRHLPFRTPPYLAVHRRLSFQSPPKVL